MTIIRKYMKNITMETSSADQTPFGAKLRSKNEICEQ